MKNTIVIVDDNEPLLDVCAQVLKNRGFRVVTFTEVSPAKAYLKSADANLIYAIISDLMMGPNDGLDFMAFVRSIQALEKTDFFLMTGGVAEVFEPYYRSLNLKGIINKPFNAPALFKALNINQQGHELKEAA